MPPISWITARERVVGRGSTKYADVDNRPLRQIVELHGFDPDDANFPGLLHFPDGLYTDTIHEETLNAGITFEDNALFNGNVNVDGDLTVLPGHLLSGDLGVIVIKTSLKIDQLATVLSESLDFKLRMVTFNILGPTTDINDIWTSIRIRTDHGTHPIRLFTYQDPTGAEGIDQRLIYWVEAPHLTFSGALGPYFIDLDSVNDWVTMGVDTFYTNKIVASWNGIYMYDSAAQENIHIHKIIDFGETGWTLGSGGTQKGGLVAGTDSLTTTQQVVNGLVSLMMNRHKLARA